MVTIIDTTDLCDFYEFLDELRESGETNMLGATPYLMLEFDLTRREAAFILKSWIIDFDPSLTAIERAEKANAPAEDDGEKYDTDHY